MEESPNYSQTDLDLVQKFKKAKSVNLRWRGYELEEGDHTLPPGRKRRPQVGERDTERVLSPDGEQYRSRSSALQNMVRKDWSREQILDSKNKLVHEGWKSTVLLPDGWFFKWTNEGKIESATTHYISDEGQLLKSAKSAIEFMQENIDNSKEFQSPLSKVTSKKRDNWGEDETVPAGRKRRVQGSSGKEHILRPNGKEFLTRCLALQHMVDEEDISSKDIMEMRSKLSYEGWNEKSYLPEGWLAKVQEGTVFESSNEVIQ